MWLIWPIALLGLMCFCMVNVIPVNSAQIPLVGCMQSSTHEDAHCERATDGNIQQHYSMKSCTHTQSGRNWWRARTSHLTHFKQVRIFNRVDCCGDRLTDFTISIDGEACFTYRSKEIFSERTFDCNKVGQVIQIDNHLITALTLCEVQVFGEPVILANPNKQLKMTGCSQSSVSAEGHCQRAIDGNTNQHYSGLSCTHTADVKGWWQASTDKVSRITHVRIYNRLDCCSERLNSFTISVDRNECSSYLSTGFISVKTFQCQATGQVVRITNKADTPLTLCEVEVFGEPVESPSINSEKLPLADCWQSSNAAAGTCERALDGKTNQNYHAGTCTHTNSEKGWWRAKSRKLSRFTHVRIYNRLDCCSDRLNDFSILVDGIVCATYHSTGFFSVQTFACDRVGQIISILNRKQSPLTLCEVEAYGIPIELTAPGPQLPLTQCLQSSVVNGGLCHKAIDGDTNQNYGGLSCMHTADERGWWQAHTHKISNITHVRIYNRLDCCSERLNDFSISVDGKECASYHSGGFFSVETFQCGVVGQVIRISNRKSSPLNFCEVHVFGAEVTTSDKVGQRLTMSECLQSTTSSGGVCQRAIDGITSQNYHAGSCSHTESERGWWLARTEKLARISHVRIYNRLDCCSDRLTDFAITVDGHECASYSSDRFFGMETFECDRVGQIVRIINRRPTPLTLCEVQVFGSFVDLRIQSKQVRLSHCSQSSTTNDGVCHRSIDGIKLQNYGDKSCTHTNAEKGWWMAKTEKTVYVTHVRIYNRLDCCSERLNDFSIIVGGQECASYQSDGFFSVKTFECNALGQVIRIENHKATPLTLCEVEVFGQDDPR